MSPSPVEMKDYAYVIQTFLVILGLLTVICSMIINFTVKHSAIERVERSYRDFDGRFAGYYFILISFIISSFIVNIIYEYDLVSSIFEYIGQFGVIHGVVLIAIFILAFIEHRGMELPKIIKENKHICYSLMYLLFSIFSVVALVTLYVFSRDALTSLLILIYTSIFVFSLIYGSSSLYNLFTMHRHRISVMLELRNDEILDCELISITKFGDLIICHKNSEYWINRSEVRKMSLN